MKWIKNKHGGFRSIGGGFYLQQSPKKFYHLFAKKSHGWQLIGGPFRDATAGQAFAEAAV